MRLEELREKLLFNSISDVWFAFCEDSRKDWSDFGAFKRFIEHIRGSGVEFKSLPVCPSGTGAKADFAKKISVLLGDPNKTYILKTDNSTVERIKSFST